MSKPDAYTSQDEASDLYGDSDTDLRELADGCIACNMSVVYCHAVREMERHPCCILCDHLGA